MNCIEEPIIRVRDLKKTYGAVPAVNGISLDISKGQMAAIMGPNGAGKSTLMGILSTAQGFDEGQIKVAGMDIRRNSRKIRQIIGVVFQNGVLDQRLTVGENLRVRADFYGLKGKRLEDHISLTAELTGISGFIDRPYGKLSGGQKRRSDIARALIHSPRILYLDEPAAGLDPGIRNSIINTIDSIRKNTEMTVLMTTHYMDEAAIADKIIIMKKGEITREGTPKQMGSYFQAIKGEWRL